MLIESIAIKGMWSFGTEEVIFDGLGAHNLIIGKNNVGKSKLLAAVALISEHSQNILPGQPFDLPTELIYDSGSERIIPDVSLSVVVFVDDVTKSDIRQRLNKQFATPRPTAMLSNINFERILITVTTHPNGQLVGSVQMLHPPAYNESAYAHIKPDTSQNISQNWNTLIALTRQHAFRDFCSHIDYVSGWRTLRALRPRNDNLNIIQELHLWRDPPQKDKHLRMRFQRIQELFRDLIRRKDVELQPESNGTNLHVTIGGRYLPIESLGDGLQHLLMIAYHIVVDPNAILLLEEPETHLHPEIQRHLMTVLRRDLKGQSFTTTHSPVLLDAGLHSHVYRVEHDEHFSTVKRCKTSGDLRRVLDLLDIRASDILQANFVIWVEGPTDRMFLRRCFDLRDAKLEEGVDYQIAYYGGRLRSHFTFGETMPELVDLMKLSRHVAMICDSDIKEAGGALDEAKQRLKEECEAVGGYYWVTAGREIENYIPDSVISRAYQELLGDPAFLISVAQFDKIGAILSAKIPDPARGDGWKVDYENNKAKVMPELLSRMTKEDLTQLGLNQNLDELIRRIRLASPETNRS